jgi:hypothetical protein
MGLIDKIKSSFGHGSPEPISLPDAMVFSQINEEAIARQTNLILKAEENGLNNLPDVNSDTLNATEESIVSAVMSQVRPNLQNYDAHQASYQNTLSGMDPFAMAAQKRGEIDIQKLQLEVKIDQESGNLFLVKQALVQVESEWSSFKEQWGVKTDPSPGLSVKTKWLILFALVFIEAYINSSLIGPYVAGGGLEAFGIAIIFPLVTVIICAYPIGYLMRRFQRPDTFRNKLIAISLIIPLTFLTLTMNLFLAFIREAAENEDDWGLGLTFLKNAFLGDFYPITTPSFLLFIFSTGLFVGAIIDVMKMDHPVPGLLDKLNRRNALHKEYSEKLKKAHDDLIYIQGNSGSQFLGVFDKLASWQINYNRVIDQQIRLSQRMRAYIEHVEDTTNSLLKKYREINISKRSSMPPKYFSSEWKFPMPEYLALPVVDTQEQYSKKLQNAANEIESAQKSLNEAFSKIPGVLKGIDELLLKVGSA